MLLYWHADGSRPKKVNLPSGPILNVDPEDGLIMGDIRDEDADRILTNCREIRVYREDDGQARLAGFRAGTKRPVGFLDGMKQAMKTKGGRSMLKSFLMDILVDEGEKPAEEAPSSPGEALGDFDEPEAPDLPHEALSGDEDDLLVIPKKPEEKAPIEAEVLDPVELQIKIADAHRMKEAHSKTELKGLCRDQNIEIDPLDRKSDLVAKLLGLPKDWDKE